VTFISSFFWEKLNSLFIRFFWLFFLVFYLGFFSQGVSCSICDI
jgi:hypothetical protein